MNDNNILRFREAWWLPALSLPALIIFGLFVTELFKALKFIMEA
jgi:hypothetical protein